MGQPGRCATYYPQPENYSHTKSSVSLRLLARFTPTDEQAKTHGKHEPIVFVKMDRKEPLAIVSAKHYLQLIKTINENRSNN